jgi:hypothetical protein
MGAKEMTDKEPIYYQDTPEGKSWADWAYKLYIYYEHPGPMAYYDEETLEENQ